MNRISQFTRDTLGCVIEILVPLIIGILLIMIPIYWLSVFLKPSSDVPVNISVSTIKYHIGETGIVKIELRNATSANITLEKVTTRFPQDFLDGFVIEYPEDCSLTEATFLAVPSISCKDVTLSANSTTTFEFSITPFKEGNFQGDIGVMTSSWWKFPYWHSANATISPAISVLPK